MISNALEFIGYALIIAFLYLVWAPLALLGAGVLLVIYANVRSNDGKAAAAFGAALSAARRAWADEKRRNGGK